MSLSSTPRTPVKVKAHEVFCGLMKMVYCTEMVKEKRGREERAVFERKRCGHWGERARRCWGECTAKSGLQKTPLVCRLACSVSSFSLMLKRQ